MEPIHEHNCENCKHLGSLGTTLGTDDVLYDMYICSMPGTALGGSVILRFGDDGPDYVSMPIVQVRETYKHEGQAAADTRIFRAAYEMGRKE